MSSTGVVVLVLMVGVGGFLASAHGFLWTIASLFFMVGLLAVAGYQVHTPHGRDRTPLQ